MVAFEFNGVFDGAHTFTHTDNGTVVSGYLSFRGGWFRILDEWGFIKVILKTLKKEEIDLQY